MHKRPLQSFAQSPAMPVPTASACGSGTVLENNDGQHTVRVFTRCADHHPVPILAHFFYPENRPPRPSREAFFPRFLDVLERLPDLVLRPKRNAQQEDRTLLHPRQYHGAS